MPTIKPYLDQSYNALKANCLKSGKLFEDDKFPANDSSIYRFQNFFGRKIFWKRPHELAKNPQFIVDHIVPNDLDQGQIGNCWVVAAAACVLSVPEYLNRVIPDDQTFDKSNYAGIFHFRFWVNGDWVEIVVDDRLPVNEHNQLIFCRNSVDTNEMFGPLLEKAYAKLNVCYEFLIGGNSKDALLDLTGGVNEIYDLTRCLPTAPKERYIDPNKLWDLMFNAFRLKSLFSCAADVKPNQKMEEKTSNGLVVGHAYSIISVFEILKVNGQFNEIRSGPKAPDNVEKIRLLLIRNPWGQNGCFKGKWSKGSAEWKQVGPKVLQTLKPETTEDGQFYMSLQDYLAFFTTMDTVHVDMDGLSNDDSLNQTDLHWNLTDIRGEWINGQNSGGCGNDPKTYWSNPQHKFTIPPIKEKCAMIVSLLQTDTAQKRLKSNGSSQGIYEALGFYIYSVKPDSKADASGRYDAKSNLPQVSRINTFMYQKEISKRVELPPGNYMIVPCLYEKNKNAKYLLRLYIEGLASPGPNNNNNNNNQNNIAAKDTKILVNPIVPVPAPIVNPNPNPKPAPGPTPAPGPNPAPIVNPNPKPGPTPAPTPAPKIPSKGELYDKWFYGGMNQKDVDNLNKQAQVATSNACLLM